MAPSIEQGIPPHELAVAEANVGVRALLEELATIDVRDRASAEARISLLKALAEQKAFPSLEPILPLVLNLNGKPYSIHDHFPFSPLFRVLMPKSQVWKTGRQLSKSTSLAAHGVVVANSIPYFKTLYVTPLYEQIRRFSNNYVRSFIDQSPVKSQWTGTDTENNVLQRSFKNKSMMLFSFALLDADRVRGVSADRMCIDESFRVGTMVRTPNGSQRIELLAPGDVVLSFNIDGAVCEDKVIKSSDHGVRECFQFEFADGSSVEATSDSFLATTAGWRRVSTVIADFYAAAAANGSGHVTGRRLRGNTRQVRNAELFQPTRILPARLQQGEVPDLIRVRAHAAQESEELRLRGMVQFLANAHLATIAPYSGYVLPGRHKNRDGRVVAPTDLGSDCLVVSGRRQSGCTQPASAFSHGGVGQAERVLVSGLAAATRRGRQSIHASQEGQISALSCNSPVGTRHASTCGEHPSVRGAVDALQDQAAFLEGCACVPLVQTQVCAEQSPQNSATSAVLREQGVRECAARPQQREVHEQTGRSRGEKRESPGDLVQRCGEESRTGESDVGCLARAKSRQGQSHQEEDTGKSSGGAGDASVDVSALRADRAAGYERFPREILSDMPQACDGRDQTPVCFEASAIVKITCTGQHRVYDIETEKHHTFFAGGVAVHNCQDLDPAHIPVVAETMSYSRYAMSHFTGTPKSLDNPLEGLYRRSSGAEWFIPCQTPGCKHWNIPAREHDLDAMIGPYRDDISEKAPGVVCAKCQKPINPRQGRWVHRHPDRRWQFAGYHVPQLLLPLHYADPEKWNTLLLKREGWGNMTQAQFYNEVMGESIDAGQKLVSETELRRVCVLPWENHKEPDKKALQNLMQYKNRVLAIDWGGGGEAGISFTVITVLGFRPDGTVDCLWGKRLIIGGDHLQEAKECMRYSQIFKCDLVAHDYTGAGTVRETVMVQAGFVLDRIMAMRLCRSAAQDLCVYKPPTAINHRAHYSLDKTRSLLYTCQAIKLGQVRFFQYDWQSQDNPGLIADFLALVENKADSRTGSDIYMITRNVLLSDDFAQAVNIGCAALWHANDAWPNFAELAGLGRISQKVADAQNPDNWEDDDLGGKYFQV